MGLIPAGAGQTGCATLRALRVSAHPRRCGADPKQHRPNVEHMGSSPQVRGRPAGRVDGSACGGLIPAGAGQTGYRTCPPWSNRAHPRRCGADHVGLWAFVAGPGSSPQVRGRLPPHRAPRHPQGLIPAGAGQTLGSRGRVVRRWAHPRRCGADKQLGNAMRSVMGSSPQVRGRR